MNLSPKKYLFFSIIALISFPLITELIARLAYFQMKSEDRIATTAVYKTAEQYVTKTLANLRFDNESKEKSQWGSFAKMAKDDIVLDDKLVDYLLSKYSHKFELFISETKNIRAKLILVQIGGGRVDPLDKSNRSRNVKKIYSVFSAIARKYQIHIIDSENIFSKQQRHHVSLMPDNAHLSRFGNQLISEALVKEINKFSGYRSNYSCNKGYRPSLFGDLSPNKFDMINPKGKLPYMLITNKHGLRMTSEIRFPKKEQRILFMGSSFMFGPYINNNHTIPGLIQTMKPDILAINAAKAGYHIHNHLSLLIARSQCVEPDIIILRTGN